MTSIDFLDEDGKGLDAEKKPKPWEDEKRPEWVREAWKDAEPKSMKKVG